MDYREIPAQKKHIANFQKLVDYTNDLLDSADSYFEAFPFPVFLVDSKGCFTFFNKAAEKFIRYTRTEVMGKHFRMLLTLDDLSNGFMLFYQSFHGCAATNQLFRIRLKEGSTRVVNLLVEPIRMDGKVIASVAIATDVTGQPSPNKLDADRVQIFKKFSADLEKWKEENKRKESINNI